MSFIQPEVVVTVSDNQSAKRDASTTEAAGSIKKHDDLKVSLSQFYMWEIYVNLINDCFYFLNFLSLFSRYQFSQIAMYEGDIPFLNHYYEALIDQTFLQEVETAVSGRRVRQTGEAGSDSWTRLNRNHQQHLPAGSPSENISSFRHYFNHRNEPNPSKTPTTITFKYHFIHQCFCTTFLHM